MTQWGNVWCCIINCNRVLNFTIQRFGDKIGELAIPRYCERNGILTMVYPINIKDYCSYYSGSVSSVRGEVSGTVATETQWCNKT